MTTPCFIARKNLGEKTLKLLSAEMSTAPTISYPGLLPYVNQGIYLRWGCTRRLPNAYHSQYRVYNRSDAIERVYNKKNFRVLLDVVKLGPKTWTNLGECLSQIDIDNLDVIIRPARHSRGRHFYRITSDTSVAHIQKALSFDDFYISEYIQKVKEFRVYMVSGRVVGVAEKIPDNPLMLAWNVHNGSKFVNTKWSKWPIDVVHKASRAFDLSRLDYGAVDVIQNKDGRAYVLEINSAPTLSSPYAVSCFAKGLDFMIDQNIRVNMRVPYAHKDEWRGYIHPAITKKAIL